ncbi:hypothetical protein FNZ56_02925 [Pseudoluteimonas lycopersici]|uniref:Zona occludens toxin N-terminal domain-containing protein n=1 Tax=Pseudoluteimonas lycopersici TaxID=1324796 RepID=A0A516V320_9GAMM|nr:zonular occludens toxin domain-containing protein [Lysobacter lycopersici]QDQ72904.1 hypothetical protein FNZ56_02925 [Lysobacter lycopersici]
MIGETTVLITGKRGNGKSLKAVGLMKQEIAAGRPVFASNFNGLRVQGVQVLDNPREWESLPTGSILFVDEAQRFWRSRRSGDPPAEVQAMETQRHLGITIVLLTQQPTYLDKHIRGLVDLHHHLMLEVGGKASRMWTWKRCMDDPEDATTRSEADQSVFLFPSSDFADYDSAEVHTIKPKVPRKLKLVAVSLIVLAGLFWFAIHRAHSIGGKPSGETRDQAGVPAVGGTPADPVRSGKRTISYATAEEYIHQVTPRIPAAPWTAPAFDGRQVVADPRVFCMSSSAGVDASGTVRDETCSCVTEQGTTYAMPVKSCAQLAAQGEIYNPFRKPEVERLAVNEDPPPVDAPADTPTLSGGNSQPFGTLASYGTLDAK